jgi:dephospho-CoA kinase
VASTLVSRLPSPVLLSVALTGNIASGKSSVAHRLASHGATIIDADVLAREVVEPGSPALAEIRARWGGDVLRDDGSLDRQAMRRIVFDDAGEREALNAIVHPRVEARRRELLEEARARGERLVISDIPLLFEKGLETRFDLIVLVDAPRDVRRARLMTVRGLSGADADRMLDAQLPSESKRARADIVIDNVGTLDELATRADALWSDLQRRAQHTA